MFLDSCIGLFIKGFVEKTSRQRTGAPVVSEASPYSPGPTEVQRFLIIDFERKCIFLSYFAQLKIHIFAATNFGFTCTSS
jgi:hypothetical protein